MTSEQADNNKLQESSIVNELSSVLANSSSSSTTSLSAPPIVVIPSSANCENPSIDNNPVVCDETVAIYYIFGKITASDLIVQGSISLPIDHWALVGNMLPQQASVRAASTGVIDLDKQSKGFWTQPVHWIRAIRLSNDCHSYNIQLKFQSAYRMHSRNIRGGTVPKLYLEVVKRIPPGQELQLWFSEELLAILQIAFLKPANIQGEKKYVCTRCLAEFETPNPLKLHITLLCGKRSISFLWNRLASIMKEFDVLQNIYTTVNYSDFKFDLNLSDVNRQKNVLDLSVAGQQQQQQSNKNELFKPYQPVSAFKPFRREKPVAIENNVNANTNIIEPLQDGGWTVHLNNVNVVQSPCGVLNNCQVPNQVYNENAQIESLVSQLGKGKQGHICLYCGKCYSRKYGLKIHIRTHTGYKPLKCKFCDRPFGDPSNLNKHVRLHAEGNTPYKCDLCGKILVRRRDLERHLKSRHVSDIQPNNLCSATITAEKTNPAVQTDSNCETEKSPTGSIIIEETNTSDINYNTNSMESDSCQAENNSHLTIIKPNQELIINFNEESISSVSS